MALKFGLLKGLLQEENFQNAFWRLKQVSNISILFQKQSMGHVGHFKFLKIFHCHLLKKCFKTAVEALKVWASKGNPAGRKCSKCVLMVKKSKKCVKMVSEWKYELFRTFWKKINFG